MPHKRFLPLLVLAAFLSSCSGQAFINLKVYENEWLKKMTSEPLNNVEVRPTILNTSEPIEISVSLVVRNFEKIDDKRQEFSIQLTLRQEWEDDRMAYAKYNPVQLRQIKHLTLLDTSKIWTPDTYFKNEKKGSIHNLMKGNNFARIYPNGTVILDTRISLTLSCPIKMRSFPYDNPTCNLQLASYSYARDDLIYKWKPIPHPITVGNGATFPTDFIFNRVTSNYCDAQSQMGVYSCLLAEFHFMRSRSHYLKQVYIPMANMVITAWLSFLLDYRSDKTFLLRGILCLAALSTSFSLTSRIGQNLPTSAFTSALDVWTGISLTFVFYALVEFIVVHYLSTHDFGFGTKSVEPSARSSQRNSTFEDVEMTRTKIEGSLTIEPENVEVAERKPSVEVKPHWAKRITPEAIEKWSKVLYPAFYIGFVLIYWLVCANAGDSNS